MPSDANFATATALPLRIVTMVSTLTLGGTERTAVNYAIAYKRAGQVSALFAYCGGGVRQAALTEAGVELFLGAEDPSVTHKAIQDVINWKPDIVHIHRNGSYDLTSSHLLRLLKVDGVRIVETNVFSNVDESNDRLLIDLHFHLGNWCLWKWRQSADRLVPRPAGVVLPYMVDCSAFYRISDFQRVTMRKKLGVPTNALVFGRVGQPLYAKWSPLIFDVFQEVAKTVGHAWLVVAGLPPELLEKHNNLPPETRNRVVMLPTVTTDTELCHYYGVMDIFLHISQKGESFGMVLCEAMLCELPVITLSTPLRDNTQIEIVMQGKTGIIATDKRSLVDACLSMAREPDRPRLLGRAARQNIAERFESEIVCSAALHHLRTLIWARDKQGDYHPTTNGNEVDLHQQGASWRSLLERYRVGITFRERLVVGIVNRRRLRQLIIKVKGKMMVFRRRLTSIASF